MLTAEDRLAIRELLALYGHQLAHHTVDVIVTVDGDGTVRVLSKGIGLLADGRAGGVLRRPVPATGAQSS